MWGIDAATVVVISERPPQHEIARKLQCVAVDAQQAQAPALEHDAAGGQGVKAPDEQQLRRCSSGFSGQEWVQKVDDEGTEVLVLNLLGV